MRIVKMRQPSQKLQTVMHKFLLVKASQHLSEETLRDDQSCLNRFVDSSQDSLEYTLLEEDVLHFFSAIPNTSPARYNKPFQYINAFLNWMVEQEYIPKNPMKAHKLHKRKDEGNIKPVSIEALQTFIAALDRTTYTGLRDYTIIMVMLDTGIRTKELLALRNSDYSPATRCLMISKMTAKTRTQRTAYLNNSTAHILEEFLSCKPEEWEGWLFPNYEGKHLEVQHLDKAFAKNSAKCGVKITPYQLRHSFATLYLKSGGDLFTLQHLMGHADLRMTRRYTEVDETYVEQQHKSFSPVNLLQNSRVSRLKRI